MPENNVPNNLPVEGRDLLENVNQQTAGAVLPKTLPPAPAPNPPEPAIELENPPANEGTQDIFADIKESAQQADQPSKPEKPTIVETPHQGFKKVILTVSSIVIFAGVLGAGGYFAYIKFLKPQPLSPYLNLSNTLTNSVNTETQTTETETTTTTEQPAITDSDNDGLTDIGESALGTDYLNPDTDGDKLFDAEEVNVYKTDPLKADTDGDGYEDGMEVQNGFDPNGLGKLIVIPAQ